MRRRDFIALLGAAAAWPLEVQGQQRPIPVVGFLGGGSAETSKERVRAFRLGLAEKGYVEGRNVLIEYRWAEGQNEQLPELAADLVRHHVAAIATAGGIPAALAAKAATATIPIVFQIGVDPVPLGLVASLNRPGANVTGITSLNRALEPKRLEVLHEAIPTATVMAYLINPNNSVNPERRQADVQAAAATLGLRLHFLNARTEGDFDSAFAAAALLQVGGLVIAPDPLFSDRSDLLAAAAARHAMPTISPYREFALTGGLGSYGENLVEQHRQVGIYVGSILSGAKPGDLPVQQATKVELAINLKTAKTLGITFPLTLLGRADEIIE